MVITGFVIGRVYCTRYLDTVEEQSPSILTIR
jgi:hypothetical protein